MTFIVGFGDDGGEPVPTVPIEGPFPVEDDSEDEGSRSGPDFGPSDYQIIFGTGSFRPPIIGDSPLFPVFNPQQPLPYPDVPTGVEGFELPGPFGFPVGRIPTIEELEKAQANARVAIWEAVGSIFGVIVGVIGRRGGGGAARPRPRVPVPRPRPRRTQPKPPRRPRRPRKKPEKPDPLRKIPVPRRTAPTPRPRPPTRPTAPPTAPPRPRVPRVLPPNVPPPPPPRPPPPEVPETAPPGRVRVPAPPEIATPPAPQPVEIPQPTVETRPGAPSPAPPTPQRQTRPSTRPQVRISTLPTTLPGIIPGLFVGAGFSLRPLLNRDVGLGLNLTPQQEPSAQFQPERATLQDRNRCEKECAKREQRKKRTGRCRKGFFREFENGERRVTWEEEKCKRIRRRSKRSSGGRPRRKTAAQIARERGWRVIPGSSRSQKETELNRLKAKVAQKILGPTGVQFFGL